VLFTLLKLYSRFIIHLYCRKIVVNKPEMLNVKGPLLLAANHPNSFLDGIIMATILKQDLYSLARGDAFKKHSHSKLLKRFKLLPVYRTSEGVENLGHNYTTFEACRDVFKEGGIVIIFSEGRCINEWHLRPLKKGTARLAVRSWLQGMDVPVIPVGFNYNAFRTFGKNVFINFGEPLDEEEILKHRSDGKLMLSFNEQLESQLRHLVYEIDKDDLARQKKLLSVPVPLWKKILLTVPAILGFVLHAPFYFAGKALTKTYFDNDHFDSALASMLMLSYPVYVLLLFLIAGVVFSWWIALVLVPIIIFSAYAALQLKPQI
jgi:1-acyl-sn-glycerol-3-phosphate acyltransferase